MRAANMLLVYATGQAFAILCPSLFGRQKTASAPGCVWVVMLPMPIILRTFWGDCELLIRKVCATRDLKTLLYLAVCLDGARLGIQRFA